MAPKTQKQTKETAAKKTPIKITKKEVKTTPTKVVKKQPEPTQKVDTTTSTTTPTNERQKFFHDLNLKDNIHIIIGIICLIAGFRLLWKMLFGLLFIVGGILFITGFFEDLFENNK